MKTRAANPSRGDIKEGKVTPKDEQCAAGLLEETPRAY